MNKDYINEKKPSDTVVTIPGYPCKNCSFADACGSEPCSMWREWFAISWRRMREFYRPELKILHDKQKQSQKKKKR